MFTVLFLHGREGLIGLKGWLRREPQKCLGPALTTATITGQQPLLQLFNTDYHPNSILTLLPFYPFHHDPLPFETDFINSNHDHVYSTQLCSVHVQVGQK